MKINKSILFKIIIVILDIIALTMFIIATYRWFNKKMNTDNSEALQEQQKFTFKKFNYNIHPGIQYNNLNDYKFMLSNDKYDATIMPYVANTDDDLIPLSSYANEYSDYLRDHGLDVQNTDIYTINDKTIYTFSIADATNSILCYYQTFSPFYYEIGLVNKNNTFDIESLNEIIDALQDVYYDQESKELFDYYTSEEVFHQFDIDE